MSARHCLIFDHQAGCMGSDDPEGFWTKRDAQERLAELAADYRDMGAVVNGSARIGAYTYGWSHGNDVNNLYIEECAGDCEEEE